MICATPRERTDADAVEHPSPPDPSQRKWVADEHRVIRVEPDLKFGRDPFNRPSRESVFPWVVSKALAHFDYYFLTRDWSWRWGQKVARLAADQHRLSKYDILIVDIPPLPAVIPILRRAREEGIPIVSDFRDLWMPDERVSTFSWFSPEGRRQIWRNELSTAVVGASASIVLTTPEACDAARAAFPTLDPLRFQCITNAFDEPDSDEQASASVPDVPNLLYTGSLAYGRDRLVETVIRAMGILRRRGEGIRLTLAGTPSAALDRLAVSEGVCDLVSQVGWVGRDDVVQLQREAGALLLLQPPNARGISEAIPAKLFEYMERRRHILSISTPAADEIVEDYDLGIVASALAPPEMADALLRLRDRVRARPVLPAPPERFSGERTVAELAEILDVALSETNADRQNV